MRNKIVEKSQAYHIFIHVLFGFLCALTVSKHYTQENLFSLLLLGFLGNIIPDIDHVIYYFTYGRDSEYSKIIKIFVKERDFKDIKNFLRDNHKYLTGLYSHTLVSFFLSVFLVIFFFKKESIYLGTFFLSVTVHFLYDMLEDLLFFKKLNPNWFMKFNRVNKNNKGIEFPYLNFFRNKK